MSERIANALKPQFERSCLRSTTGVFLESLHKVECQATNQGFVEGKFQSNRVAMVTGLNGQGRTE